MSLRFTLVLGSYNHARFLPRCLASLREQTQPPAQIVFFDDGSRDDSLRIAREHLGGDPRVTWIDDLDRNMGLLPRLGLVAERIDPDNYVVPCGGDDFLDPRCFEVHAKNIAATETRWSVAAIDEVDEATGSPLRRIEPSAMVRALPSASPLLPLLLDGTVFPPVHGWAFSAGLLREVGGWDPSFAQEDLTLLFRFAARVRPAFSLEKVSNVRVRPGQFARWNGRLPRDAARLALGLAREHPAEALEYASRQYLGAASGFARAGQWGNAALDLARSGILWPIPTAPHYSRALRALLAKLRAP